MSVLELNIIKDQDVEIRALKAKIERLDRTVLILQDVAEELKRCGNCKRWSVCGCKKTGSYHNRSDAASNCEHWELLKSQSAECKGIDTKNLNSH